MREAPNKSFCGIKDHTDGSLGVSGCPQIRELTAMILRPQTAGKTLKYYKDMGVISDRPIKMRLPITGQPHKSLCNKSDQNFILTPRVR
jgi:hypothetical protein